MSTETLVTCPDCGQANLTARGLAPHRKSKHCLEARGKAAALNLAELALVEARPPTMQLADMTADQLGEMAVQLHSARDKAEGFSGLCATLDGLVLAEAKKRIGHGGFKPWLEERFPKAYRTAALYMQLGKAFVKSAPKCTFEQLTLALMDGAQDFSGEALDLAHPTVSAVSKWVKGRSFYQLRKEELSQGGVRPATCPHCDGELESADQSPCPHCGKETAEPEPTIEETRALLIQQETERAHELISDPRHAKQLWRMIPDHHLQALAAFHAEQAKEMAAWLKTPKKQREQLALEEVLG